MATGVSAGGWREQGYSIEYIEEPETGAQVIYFQALREQNPVLHSFRWKGYQACRKDLAPNDAPALALSRPPASGQPIQPPLGTPNRRACGPRFLQHGTQPSRWTHRRNEQAVGDDSLRHNPEKRTTLNLLICRLVFPLLRPAVTASQFLVTRIQHARHMNDTRPCQSSGVLKHEDPTAR